MHIDQLHIAAFRGVQDLTLHLTPQEPNVLIGFNGSGKTTVLDSLACLLGELIQLLGVNPGAPLPTIGLEDVPLGQSAAACEVTATWFGDKQVNWSLTYQRHSSPALTRDLGVLPAIADHLQSSITPDEPTGLPVLVYYPTRRDWAGQPTADLDWSQASPLSAYRYALTVEACPYTELFSWLQWQTDRENEQRLAGDLTYQNPALAAVYRAVDRLVPDVQAMRLGRSPTRMTVTLPAGELEVRRLSAGERNWLALVADLARRLAIANPQLADPCQGEGIVLIDEIEQHIHPKWQTELIPELRAVFPQCQFIISTHSPQVIRDLEPEGIYIL